MRHMTTLRYIDTVARTGSIRAAADRLSITASALNRRILAIEEELGVELFERHASGVRLNSAGELFVHHIRTQQADLERVRSRISDLQGNRRGHVRIAATRALAQRFLPSHIAAYRARFPGVTFELHSCSSQRAERMLLEMDVDLLVSLAPIQTADFQSLAIAPQRMIALIPPDHALAARTEVSLVDCVEHPLIMPPMGDGVRDQIEQGLARKGLACAPAIECDDPSVVADLIARGAGIGFATPQCLPPNLPAIALREVDTAPALLAIGHRRGRALPVSAGKFAEGLVAVL